MMIFRLGILVLVISIVTWIAMKYFNRPMNFGLILLFWIAVFLLVGVMFFGLSTWVANLNNF